MTGKLAVFCQGHRVVGLDTMLFIYQFEKYNNFWQKTKIVFSGLEEGKFKGVTSVIGLIEILTKPKIFLYYFGYSMKLPPMIPYKYENAFWLYLLRFQKVLEGAQKSFQVRQMPQRNNQIDQWFQAVKISTGHYHPLVCA